MERPGLSRDVLLVWTKMSTDALGIEDVDQRIFGYVNGETAFN